ncbi:18287_t:CDS:2, partial [Gigaspora rosea]
MSVLLQIQNGKMFRCQGYSFLMKLKKNVPGQGTIAMEILRQHNLNEIDTIFHIKIIRVETYDANATTLSLKEKKRVTLDEVGLFADGAAIRACSEVIDEVTNVANDEICAAIKDIFE